MGELKQLSEEQKGLVERVKEVGRKVYLANVGLLTLVEEEGKKQYEKALVAGEQARGAEAALTSKALLVAFGVVETVKTEASKLSVEAVREQVKVAREKIQASNLLEEAQKFFEELVVAGEKRTAA